MKLQNINFKKVFIVFFALFLVFTAVSTIFAISDGQWSDAVEFEQSRLEARNNRALNERGHGSRWRHGHANQTNTALTDEAYSTQAEPTEANMSAHTPGNKVLRHVARTYVRITSPDFTIWKLFSSLFHIVFTALLALWVFVDSKKHGRNTLLWTAITVVTSIFGLIAYLLFCKRNTAPPITT